MKKRLTFRQVLLWFRPESMSPKEKVRIAEESALLRLVEENPGIEYNETLFTWVCRELKQRDSSIDGWTSALSPAALVESRDMLKVLPTRFRPTFMGTYAPRFRRMMPT